MHEVFETRNSRSNNHGVANVGNGSNNNNTSLLNPLNNSNLDTTFSPSSLKKNIRHENNNLNNSANVGYYHNGPSGAATAFNSLLNDTMNEGMVPEVRT